MCCQMRDTAPAPGHISFACMWPEIVNTDRVLLWEAAPAGLWARLHEIGVSATKLLAKVATFVALASGLQPCDNALTILALHGHRCR